MTAPRVLTIAGSDPSGGAGLQADLKTFHALGCYGMAVVTALTAQSTVGVSGVHAPPPSFVAAQIEALLGDCPPAATKTGMLFSVEIVEEVARWARGGDLGRLVVDPVMVATSGDRLLREEAEAAVRELLLPRADVVTPNLPEAAVLTRRALADARDAEDAARALVALGARAALVKGGHGSGATELVDVLLEGSRAPVRMVHERIAGGPFHGTGCTLSAALAARLACGSSIERAARDAVAFVQSGLRHAWPVGAGARPVDHLAAGRERGAS